MKKFLILIFMVFVSLQAVPLQIGDDAPEFILKDQEGYAHNLSAHRGSFVLLFFYPRDFTPPAQKKLKTMQSLISDSLNSNFVVYGISTDTIDKHRQFYDKMHISFDLLSDVEGGVISAYKANGFIETKPLVVLIGPDGRLFKVYENMQKFLYSSNLIKSIINRRI
ncbi:MAG: Thiol-disulfide oxidoreductase ResA [Chlamydiia bacterium]|nr:Thiol-disulfide oxidoreductase ResA [Chlamydiia bacterium]